MANGTKEIVTATDRVHVVTAVYPGLAAMRTYLPNLVRRHTNTVGTVALCAVHFRLVKRLVSGARFLFHGQKGKGF